MDVPYRLFPLQSCARRADSSSSSAYDHTFPFRPIVFRHSTRLWPGFPHEWHLKGNLDPLPTKAVRGSNTFELPMNCCFTSSLSCLDLTKSIEHCCTGSISSTVINCSYDFGIYWRKKNTRTGSTNLILADSICRTIFSNDKMCSFIERPSLYKAPVNCFNNKITPEIPFSSNVCFNTAQIAFGDVFLRTYSSWKSAILWINTDLHFASSFLRFSRWFENHSNHPDSSNVCRWTNTLVVYVHLPF